MVLFLAQIEPLIKNYNLVAQLNFHQFSKSRPVNKRLSPLIRADRPVNNARDLCDQAITPLTLGDATSKDDNDVWFSR
jgi:hypothetical protein